MTVALGFHCKDGVVLAADSEISNAFLKYQGDKAWIYKYPRKASQFALQVGIVGAGDAAFIQYASERIDASLDEYIDQRKRLTMAEVNSVVQGVINDIHHTHLYPVPPATHEPPRVELIIGIWLSSTRNRLAKTYLTALTKVWNYEAVGIGSALANFIIKRFYGGRVTVSQAVFIAAQVLMHVKENVPACGGESKVIAMFKHGDVGFIQSDTINDHERFLRDFDRAIEPVFFGGADQSLGNEQFQRRVDALSATLKALRKVETLKERAAQVSEDAKIVAARFEMFGPVFVPEDPTATPLKPQSGRVKSMTPTPKHPKRGRKRRPPSRG